MGFGIDENHQNQVSFRFVGTFVEGFLGVYGGFATDQDWFGKLLFATKQLFEGCFLADLVSNDSLLLQEYKCVRQGVFVEVVDVVDSVLDFADGDRDVHEFAQGMNATDWVVVL